MSPKTLSAAALLVLVVAGCAAAATPGVPASSPTSPPVPAAFESTQRSDGGDVTVEVTWPGPAAGAVFDVKLDTHSVDLDGLDLSDAVLTNDRGERLASARWGAPKGGHHREGQLAFGGDAASFLADARWIELTVVGVGANPERLLRWEVPA